MTLFLMTLLLNNCGDNNQANSANNVNTAPVEAPALSGYFGAGGIRKVSPMLQIDESISEAANRNAGRSIFTNIYGEKEYKVIERDLNYSIVNNLFNYVTTYLVKVNKEGGFSFINEATNKNEFELISKEGSNSFTITGIGKLNHETASFANLATDAKKALEMLSLTATFDKAKGTVEVSIAAGAKATIYVLQRDTGNADSPKVTVRLNSGADTGEVAYNNPIVGTLSFSLTNKNDNGFSFINPNVSLDEDDVKIDNYFLTDGWNVVERGSANNVESFNANSRIPVGRIVELAYTDGMYGGASADPTGDAKAMTNKRYIMLPRVKSKSGGIYELKSFTAADATTKAYGADNGLYFKYQNIDTGADDAAARYGLIRSGEEGNYKFELINLESDDTEEIVDNVIFLAELAKSTTGADLTAGTLNGLGSIDTILGTAHEFTIDDSIEMFLPEDAMEWSRSRRWEPKRRGENLGLHKYDDDNHVLSAQFPNVNAPELARNDEFVKDNVYLMGIQSKDLKSDVKVHGKSSTFNVITLDWFSDNYNTGLSATDTNNFFGTNNALDGIDTLTEYTINSKNGNADNNRSNRVMYYTDDELHVISHSLIEFKPAEAYAASLVKDGGTAIATTGDKKFDVVSVVKKKMEDEAVEIHCYGTLVGSEDLGDDTEDAIRESNSFYKRFDNKRSEHRDQ